MLRDEGGRMADEESQVFVGMPPAPNTYDFDFEDEGAPIAAPAPIRGDVPAKPAVVVGLAQARRQKRASGAPPPPPSTKPPPPPPNPSARAKGGTAPPPLRGKPQLPKPFEDPTRAVQGAELLAAVRNAPGPGRVSPFDDAPTRLGDIDARLLDAESMSTVNHEPVSAKFIGAATEPEAVLTDPFGNEDEATRMANIDGIAALERANRTQKPSREESTRAVDIRNDPSMSDVDWDID
jgi:hypothetical protein